MKLLNRIKQTLVRGIPILLALSTALIGIRSAEAQQAYRNIVNAPYRTVSDGPQSALIVDVKNPSDLEATRLAAHKQYQTQLDSQRGSIKQELAYLRKNRMIPQRGQFPLVNAAIARSGGRLALPKIDRTRAQGDITFTFPTDPAITGSWSLQKASDLTKLVNLLYPELKQVLGTPLWTGNVTVLNLDPKLNTNDEILGALLIINGNDVTIDFPNFREDQVTFLAMAQVMAQAFHGPLRTGYDAWEQGMARAAAVVAAQDLKSYNGTAIDPANGFFYAPGYDLLNQPALANNTFSPATKSGQPLNITTLAGMLVPRLQMSSTAWLKCYIENHNFFAQFNAAYYTAVTADSTVANDTVRLRNIAKSVLPTIELQDFDAWFEQQHVLDTSVSQGAKLFAYVQPTFPSGTTAAGAAVFIVYYQTTSVGDEKDLDGTAQIIYWDYSFQNRLFLPTFETVSIVKGFGTVAPIFVNIGGTPPDTMRIAMDFPVNSQYVRVYFPAGQTGAIAKPETSTNFSGVIVGANSGSLNVVFDNGASFIMDVTQGVFGAKAVAPATVPSNFSRTRFTFTPTGGTTALSSQRNVYIRPDTDALGGVEPLFQLLVPAVSTTLAHTFPAGAQMLSLPIIPFSNDIAKVLGVDKTKLLLAQYRQDIQAPPAADKYLRYPSLPLYQPGLGLFGSFQNGLVANLTGQSTDIQQDLTVPLQYGWNQIGTPYNLNLNLTSQLFVQYLGGDVLSLPDAITRGIVAAGVMGYSPTTGYADITSATAGAGFPQNTLEPWKGYWVRVLVTEGVNLSYINPNAPTRRIKIKSRAIATVSDSNSWKVPLTVTDSAGNRSGAVFGQSSRASETFTPSLDVATPPAFTRDVMPGVRFIHNDWNPTENGTEFLADYRRSGSRTKWETVVSLPQGEGDYNLNWSDTATVPKGTRLTLVDGSNGRRLIMNSVSSYAFRTAKGETTRKFQIIAEPHSQSTIQVRNIRIENPAGRASGVTIAFELSGDAETSVEIQLNGRAVRKLSQGRAISSGTNQMVWDLKDDKGRALPGGQYLINVTAKTTEGAITRQVVPVLITR